MIAKAIDSLVAAFAPALAIRRMAARARLNRGYSGAESNRLSAGMNPKNQPADQEMIGPNGASKMRAWSRMLVRDNAYASGVVDTIVASVVGTGIGVQSVLETQDGEDVELTNERRDSCWAEWCETCELTGQYNFDEVQAICLREMVEAGEVLIHLVTVPEYFHGIHRKIPLALELIEADRLAEDRDTHPISRRIGKRIVRGVELNEIGMPVAYWVYPAHPNDPTTLRIEPVRIEAKNILHLFRRDRVGQNRGVSWFAPVVSWMRNLGIFVENEMQSGAVGACLAAFIVSETAGSGLIPSADSERTDGNGNTYEYLEPGMIGRLRPGESIQHVTPQRPNSNAEPWLALMLRGIAVGTGLSYEIVARDFSQTNYSSNRASQLEDRRRFRRWQRYLCDNLLQPVWDRFCHAATLSRHVGVFSHFPTASELQIDIRRFAPAAFMPQSWEWVDPQAEQSSAEAAIRAGMSTYQDELAKVGKMWKNVIWQRAKEEAEKKKAGIKTSVDAETGQEQGKQANAEMLPIGNKTKQPSGEMAALSTLQFKRNRKAIETILGELAAGTTTEQKARVYLASIGLGQSSIDALIQDALDGSGKLETVEADIEKG